MTLDTRAQATIHPRVVDEGLVKEVWEHSHEDWKIPSNQDCPGILHEKEPGSLHRH